MGYPKYPSNLGLASLTLCLATCSVLLLTPFQSVGAVSLDSPGLKSEMMYEVDFSKADVPFEKDGKVQGASIKGEAPKDWDFTSTGFFPNKLTVTVMPDDGETQSSFLRLDSKVTEPHNRFIMRFVLNKVVPVVKQPSMVRFKIRLRGTPGVRLRFGIRDFQHQHVLNGGWQEISETFLMPPDNKYPDSKFGIEVEVQSGGRDTAVLDLTTLSLESMSVKSIGEFVKNSYGEKGYPANLLRHSSFVAGLPSGWTVLTGRLGGVFAELSTPDDVKGPNGQPVLKVTATNDNLFGNATASPGEGTTGIVLISEPLDIPLSTDPHVYSIYVKGTGTVEADVRHSWGTTANANPKVLTLTPDMDWTRIEIPFRPKVLNPKPHSSSITLNMKKGETILLAAPQLEKGDKAGAPVSQEEAEVTLSVTPETQVQFLDQPAEVAYGIVGLKSPAILKARVTNAYGDTKELDPVALSPGDSPVRGKINYAVFPNRPLGSHRVESWVEREGVKISPYDERVVTRLRQPHYWGLDAPDSYFGSHFDAHPRIVETAKAIGINWIRDFSSSWTNLQPKEDDFRLRREHSQVYHDGKVSVLSVLANAPPWAMAKLREDLDPANYPKDMELWKTFVRRFLTETKGNVDAINIWNEPWISHHISMGKSKNGNYVKFENPYEKYEDLVKAAKEVTMEVDPSVKVVGVNATASSPEWSEGMVANGGLDHCDVADFHTYQMADGYPGDGFETAIKESLDPIFKAKPEFPVWMTEGSPNAHMNGPGLNKWIQPGEAEDKLIASRSDRLIRWTLNLLSQGTSKIFYYTMGGAAFPESGAWGWRQILDQTGVATPEAAAISNLAYYIEKTEFVESMTPVEGVAVYIFAVPDGSRSVAVIGSSLALKNPPNFSLPEDKSVTIEDMYGNPLPAGSKLGSTAVFVAIDGSADKLKLALGTK